MKQENLVTLLKIIEKGKKEKIFPKLLHREITVDDILNFKDEEIVDILTTNGKTSYRYHALESPIIPFLKIA